MMIRKKPKMNGIEFGRKSMLFGNKKETIVWLQTREVLLQTR